MVVNQRRMLLTTIFCLIVPRSYHDGNPYLCFQLKMAKVMALIYALVMCLVLISIILDIRSNPCSPTAIFFFTVAGTFIVSAMLHPQVRHKML